MSKILDLAKNGIYYRPLDTGPAQPTAQEEDGDTVRGFKKAMHQIPQTAGGAVALVGDLVGSDGMREYGMDVYNARAKKIEEISKPSDSLSTVLEGEGNAVDWAQNAAGYVGGQVLSAVATGGVGGFIGKQLAKRGIQSIVDRGVTSVMAKQVADKVARRGAIAGAGTALFGQNLMQEAGSIYPEAVHHAEDEGRTLDGGDKARVVGSAVVAAGVDTAMDALMMGRVMSGARRTAVNEAGEQVTEGVLKAARRELPMAMAREGVTEGIQTGIERWGAQKDLGSADAIREYVDSIGVGVVGGGMGGAISVLHAQKVPDAGPLSRAANTAIEAQIAEIEANPDAEVQLADGSVTDPGRMAAYLTQFQEGEQRTTKKNELLGLDENGEPVEQEPEPEPEYAATPEEQQAKLAEWGAAHEPATLEYAHALLAAPGAKGKNLMIAPHPAGQGYTVVPSNWLTLDTQATLGGLQKPVKAEAPKAKGKKPKTPAPVPVSQPDTSWQDNPYAGYKFAEPERAQQFMLDKQADPEQFWVQPEGDQFVIKPKSAAPAPAAEPAAPALPEAAATIYNPVGKPFVTEFSAKLRLKKDGLSDTHEIVAIDDGFVLQPKGTPDAAGIAAVPENGSAGRDSSGGNAAGPAGADGIGAAPVDAGNEQQPAAVGEPGPAAEPDPVHATGSADADAALIEAAANEAATSPLNDLAEPTPAQAKAGNYKKGRVKLHGLDFAIENPAGSVRKGVSPDGKAWENKLEHHYGDISGSKGADGDAVDAFIGPNPASKRVFVVDQVDPATGKFDEHKALFGFDSLEEARAGYAANYEAGWQGGKEVSETSIEGFKTWLNEGDTKAPYAEQVGAQAAPDAAQKRIEPHDVAIVRAVGSSSVDVEKTLAGLPPVPDGHIRLFRAESPTTKFDDVFNADGLTDFRTDKPGARYTQDLKYADYYRQSYGRDASIHYIDAPADVAEKGKLDEAEYAIEVDGQGAQTTRDDGTDIPKAFYSKVKVPIDAYVEETGTTETVEIPAGRALASVREDIANLKALIKCMKG